MKLYSHAHGQQRKTTNRNIIYSAKLNLKKEKRITNGRNNITKSCTICPKTVFHIKKKNKNVYIPILHDCDK